MWPPGCSKTCGASKQPLSSRDVAGLTSSSLAPIVWKEGVFRPLSSAAYSGRLAARNGKPPHRIPEAERAERRVGVPLLAQRDQQRREAGALREAQYAVKRRARRALGVADER